MRVCVCGVVLTGSHFASNFNISSIMNHKKRKRFSASVLFGAVRIYDIMWMECTDLVVTIMTRGYEMGVV